MELTSKPITAFVLAGGQSTRMGEDKAFVCLNGKTLLAKALQTARAITPEVRIVGPSGKFAEHAPVVEDIYVQRGPLAGIHSALTRTMTNLNLILAVDLPFLTSGFLNYLCQRAEGNDSLVTVPRAEGRWQPLCAVYRKAFTYPAERALEAGQNKIDSIFPTVSVACVGEQEIKAAGFSLEIFRNVNTQEQLRQVNR